MQNADIWQLNLPPASPDPRPVLEHAGDERYPSFSPDGRRIVFRSDQDLTDRSGDEELFVMNADGTSLVQLTNNAVFDSAPAFSPDGRLIAFESARDSGDPRRLDIYVMGARGGAVRRLTDDPAHDEGPIWSPDGTKIAFASERDGQEEVYVMDADGGNERRVTNDPARDESPDWQPVPFDLRGHKRCGDISLAVGGARRRRPRAVVHEGALARAALDARGRGAPVATADPAARHDVPDGASRLRHARGALPSAAAPAGRRRLRLAERIAHASRGARPSRRR